MPLKSAKDQNRASTCSNLLSGVGPIDVGVRGKDFWVKQQSPRGRG